MNKRKVILSCAECRARNYFTPKSIEERLIVKKFCKYCNKKNFHKEEK